MKFNEAYEYSSIMSSAHSSEPATIKDPNKYPKDNMYAWDTGTTDRGVTGFTSDLKVLTQKETVGTSSDSSHITFKTPHNDRPRRKK